MGDDGSVRTVTLVCGDWPESAEVALSIDRLSRYSSAFVIEDLCSNPVGTGELIRSRGAERLVVGLCSNDFEIAELQKEARKAGLDALGIEVVDLGAARGSSEKAALLLAAAGARAAAFAGSAPENAKLVTAPKFSRRSLFKLSIPEYRAAPSLTPSECAAPAGCTACVDTCPQRALSVSGGRISYDKSACNPCGLCVTACPTGAITNPAVTAAQVHAEVRALLERSANDVAPRGIVFTCRAGSPSVLDESWLPVRLPCAGMAPVAWLLAPLLLGASAVAVIPCDDRCPARQSEAVHDRVAYIRELLAKMGADPSLVETHPRALADASEITPCESNRSEMADAETGNWFERTEAANVLIAVKEAFGSKRGVYLEHPLSPLGLVEISEGACTGCGMCVIRCPTRALKLERGDELISISFDPCACVACGYCVPLCPEEGAIAFKRAISSDALEGGRSRLYASQTASCISCGAPLPPAKMLAKIGKMLGSDHARTLEIVSKYCMDCRGRGSVL